MRIIVLGLSITLSLRCSRTEDAIKRGEVGILLGRTHTVQMSLLWLPMRAYQKTDRGLERLLLSIEHWAKLWWYLKCRVYFLSFKGAQAYLVGGSIPIIESVLTITITRE